jgi:hypothetical protein
MTRRLPRTKPYGHALGWQRTHTLQFSFSGIRVSRAQGEQCRRSFRITLRFAPAIYLWSEADSAANRQFGLDNAMRIFRTNSRQWLTAADNFPMA